MGAWRSAAFTDDSCFPAYPHQPSEWDQLAFINCLELYHTLPDSGERQYKSGTFKRRFCPTLRAQGKSGTLKKRFGPTDRRQGGGAEECGGAFTDDACFPSKWDQLVFINCVDLYYKLPCSSEREYKSGTLKRRFGADRQQGGGVEECGGAFTDDATSPQNGINSSLSCVPPVAGIRQAPVQIRVLKKEIWSYSEGSE